MVSVEKGTIDIVKYLITAGVNINAQDSDKNTALHYAVINDQPEIVALLLKNHAKTDIMDINGQTPLSIAEKNENHNIILIFEAYQYIHDCTKILIQNILDESIYQEIPY